MSKFAQNNPENILKVNQRIEIILTSAPGKKFTSRVEGIDSKGLTLAMPMTKGQPVILSSGSKFSIRLVMDNGAYLFTCVFIDKHLTPIPVWIASMPIEVKRFQQRAFVRIDTKLPVQWQICTDEGETPIISSSTKDISGGGVRLISKQAVPLGTKLKVYLDLPDTGKLELLSEVVRVEQPQSDLPVFWIGTKYLDIAENIRSRIIKFIFKRQLEERQKGL